MKLKLTTKEVLRKMRKHTHAHKKQNTIRNIKQKFNGDIIRREG